MEERVEEEIREYYVLKNGYEMKGVWTRLKGRKMVWVDG